MSIGAILGFGCGVLSPVVLLAACVFEFLARRMSNPRHPVKEKIERRQTIADIGLVAAWVLLPAAYLCFTKLASDADVYQAAFADFMTVIIIVLVVVDVVYLYLRRSRPRAPGSKKHFWEV